MAKKWWHLIIKPSTLAFIRESRQLEDHGFFDLVHGLVYARFPYLYIGLGTGEHWIVKRYGQGLAKALGGVNRLFARRTKQPSSNQDEPHRSTWADTYHGKVMPLEAVSELVTINADLNAGDLEEVIPYTRARDLILQNPDHIVAMDCPCRSGRAQPCLPLDVCLIVGEPFAAFVLEHHPERARSITHHEAVQILKDEDARGHVHHAFFKDAMLNRFFAICNCCACCCGAMQAHQHGTPMLAASGYVCKLDETLCLGCGECVEFCQFEALSLEGVVSVIDEARCMGCGVCVSKCAQGALTLWRDPAKGEPLVVRSLL